MAHAVIQNRIIFPICSYFNWTGTSSGILNMVEAKLLSFLKTRYEGFHVNIGPVVGEEDKVWTVSLNTESKNTPLVMLHGFGAGIAFWIMNLDSLAANRPVYAMDILGFGKSSRPVFSRDPAINEKQIVESIENWRIKMNIPQMILLGHSMGGYIASNYALSYPERVKHLILADPWGFQEKPKDFDKNVRLFVKILAPIVLSFNPLAAIRVAGPFGESLVRKMRSDIASKFSILTEQERFEFIPRYIHQCNAQTPSGEIVFHSWMMKYAFAKNPMINRLPAAKKDLPMTFIYGSKSWMDSSSGEGIKTARVESSVSIRMVPEAGHHLYAEEADVFNSYVNEACTIADSNR